MKAKSKSLIEKPLIKIRWVDRENYESLEDALYVRKEVFVKSKTYLKRKNTMKLT